MNMESLNVLIGIGFIAMGLFVCSLQMQIGAKVVEVVLRVYSGVGFFFWGLLSVIAKSSYQDSQFYFMMIGFFSLHMVALLWSLPVDNLSHEKLAMRMISSLIFLYFAYLFFSRI